MLRIVAILLLAAACGGGAKTTTTPTKPAEPADPIPKTAGPDCVVVADKLAIVVKADKPDEQASARETLLARCKEDKWSDESRSCFATVETDEEVEGCNKTLTDAQRSKLGGTAPGAAAAGGGPAETMATPTKTKAAAKKSTTRGRSADPEEGGEAKSDPEEGGQHK